MSGTTPARWYAQPDGTQRFWTGGEWSAQTRPGAPAQVHTGALVPAGHADPPQRHVAPGRASSGASTQVAPKSPGLALLGSFFVPGLGQLMNGDAGKGVLVFCLYVLSFFLMFVLIGFLTAPAVWIWGMVDAYGRAQRWNAQRGIVS